MVFEFIERIEVNLPSHEVLHKAIHKSQHCQRNWDLTRKIPAEDLQVLVTAVTQCPSKQNVAFYKVSFVTNREKIEAVHLLTDGFTTPLERFKSTTNSQVLANLLVVFESVPLRNEGPKDLYRNCETHQVLEGDEAYAAQPLQWDASEALQTDRLLAIGVAAGYLNLTANLLGYATGCCTRFIPEDVQKELGLASPPEFLMGVGFADPNRGRRVHHKIPEFLFPTFSKQTIVTDFID